MNWLIIKNDLIRNKAINLAILLFIMFSASLSVTSVVTGIQTISSISELYKIAQPPHFLQMHKGELNQENIDDFMLKNENVTYWQTVKMIDIYGENLTIVNSENSFDLSDCRLDIGIVRQNETKDLLLNSDHKKVTIHEGEIGIPMLLKQMYDLNIGDQVILSEGNFTKKFIIKEFIIDSQMNSSLASSTRILLSNEDYEAISGKVGEYEYLVEAYFENTKEASVFKTVYENEGLPQNGQAVTYAIIFTLSAFTDIITVFVLLLVSMLLIIVSFICVKYTIMVTLEEELGEIGTMKAIGFPYLEIRNIYLSKYRVLALIGVSFGYIIALLISRFFTKHISTTFGNMKVSPTALAFSVVAACIILVLINFYCKKTLKKIKKLSVVDALVSSKGFDKEKNRVKVGLNRSIRMPINWLIALRAVFYHFKDWSIVFAVVVIAVMMILIPYNLMNTFEAPEFISYMGMSLEDILIEVENGDNLEIGYEKVENVLENNEAVEVYYAYRTVRVQAEDNDYKRMNIDIDIGDYSGNELKYLFGDEPEGDSEIALSYLNADELGKEINDVILIFVNGTEKKFKISGIYQDVTSGGYTAKSKYDFNESVAKNYSVSVKLKEGLNIEHTAEEWSNTLGTGITVDPMKEFIDQTLGGVVKQLRTIVIVISIIAAIITLLITVLFMKLLLTKELPEIAVLKAIGFSVNDIKNQYLIKIGCISSIAIISGLILTKALGENIVNASLSLAGLGVKKIELIANPIIGYVICPLLLMLLILVVSNTVVRAIEKYNIISLINE